MEYVINEKYSIKPSQIVRYNEILTPLPCGKLVSIQQFNRIFEAKFNTLRCDPEILKRKFHEFQLSHNGKKKLREKINWLFQLSKSKVIKTYSGGVIPAFKVGFTTLTLPSKQIHPTSEITSKCFNQYLTEVKKRTKMENFVWRLEFQKNGNVHYHIVTDTFIDYQFSQKIWNRIINKLGYVDEYQRKFSNMTLSQYVNEQSKKSNATFEEFSKRYAKGCREKWQNPRSVDVVSCQSNNNIAFYISKYFSKKNDEKIIKNPLDNEKNSFALRLWFCSRSLSSLKSINYYTDENPINWIDCLKGTAGTLEVVLDFAHCLFYSVSNIIVEYKIILSTMFNKYAISVNYNSA